MSPAKQPRSGRRARLVAALSTVLLLAGIGVVDLERTAPGPLSAVHGSVVELAGDCSACHGGWFGDMTSACTECHEEVEHDIAAGVDLHGTQPHGLDPERCGLCHGEHNGAGFALVGPRAFAISGIGSREDVDHARFGFEMSGKHLELSCVECHESADVEVLGEGFRRFQGKDQACASCHESDHPAAYPEDCTTCHSQAGFDAPAWPGHAERFELSGVHATSACSDCHTDGSSIELRLQQLDAPEPTRSCADCHAAPHSDDFLDASAEASPGVREQSCAACHPLDHGPFVEADELFGQDLHAATGFPLGAPHQDLDCAACHLEPTGPDGTPLAFELRHPGRAPDSCAACHTDPHGGQFVEAGATAARCVDCHERTAFAPTAFDADRHGELQLALDGAHGRSACSDCHLPLDESALLAPEPTLVQVDVFPRDRDRRAFRGTDSSCAACHEDAHDGFFGAGPSAGDCTTCHGVERFDEVGAGFDHGRDAGFRLEASHGQGDCSSCHAPLDEPEASGRSFAAFDGFLEQQGSGPGAGDTPPRRTALLDHGGLDQACAACHEDIHAAGLRSDAGLGDTRDCAGCHVPISFSMAADSFDHEASTDFALAGLHAELDCGACHSMEQGGAPGSGKLERQHALGAACVDCHADPHQGQFGFESPGQPGFLDFDPGAPGAESRADCARCHSPERPFFEPRFNHSFDSRFRLEGRHAELDCAACHSAEQTEAGVGFVRYRPLAIDCSACHGVQDAGDLRRSSGSR
ncbi:MAG: hypothetical protein P1V81_15360 [Planctomycetota bacterium]|nr:hypothetical protein [Planctomycetota bacterium]